MKRVAAFSHGKGQGQRDHVEAVNVTHALCDFTHFVWTEHKDWDVGRHQKLNLKYCSSPLNMMQYSAGVGWRSTDLYACLVYYARSRKFPVCLENPSWRQLGSILSVVSSAGPQLQHGRLEPI